MYLCKYTYVHFDQNPGNPPGRVRWGGAGLVVIGRTRGRCSTGPVVNRWNQGH
jgi:hypothetical protein